MSKNINIIYRLSEKGQKYSVLNNGDGKKKQIIQVKLNEYNELLEIASVSENGDIILDINSMDYRYITVRFPGYPCENIKFDEEFDKPLTEEFLLKKINSIRSEFEKSKIIGKRKVLIACIAFLIFLIIQGVKVAISSK